MLVLLTDFGLSGPYMGQVRAVLATHAPAVPVIDLFADLPAFQPRCAAYLLPAYCQKPFPAGTVFVCVVDPGVGTDRAPVMIHADGYWFVGPDNGLFSQVVRRARQVAAWRIDWVPETVSATFHGRDIFAPVAAALARGEHPGSGQPEMSDVTALDPASLDRADWPDDWLAVIYIDHYGNLITGLRASQMPEGAVISVQDQVVGQYATFGDVPEGDMLCYANSNGLMEIAVHGGAASTRLGVALQSPILCLELGE